MLSKFGGNSRAATANLIIYVYNYVGLCRPYACLMCVGPLAASVIYMGCFEFCLVFEKQIKQMK